MKWLEKVLLSLWKNYITHCLALSFLAERLSSAAGESPLVILSRYSLRYILQGNLYVSLVVVYLSGCFLPMQISLSSAERLSWRSVALCNSIYCGPCAIPCDLCMDLCMDPGMESRCGPVHGPLWGIPRCDTAGALLCAGRRARISPKTRSNV